MTDRIWGNFAPNTYEYLFRGSPDPWEFWNAIGNGTNRSANPDGWWTWLEIHVPRHRRLRLKAERAEAVP